MKIFVEAMTRSFCSWDWLLLRTQIVRHNTTGSWIWNFSILSCGGPWSLTDLSKLFIMNYALLCCFWNNFTRTNDIPTLILKSISLLAPSQWFSLTISWKTSRFSLTISWKTSSFSLTISWKTSRFSLTIFWKTSRLSLTIFWRISMYLVKQFFETSRYLA